MSKDSNHFGVIARIITEAFASQNIAVEFGWFPWKRTLHLVKQGSWDCTAPWAATKIRKKQFILSDPIIEEQMTFFHRKGSTFSWSALTDLGNLKIGATLGYNYGEAFEKAEDQGNIHVRRVSRDSQNFHKLLNYRIDLFPINHQVGLEMLQNYFSKVERQRITFHPKPLLTRPLHVLFRRVSKRGRQMAELFNAGLKKLKSSGKYEHYLTNFYLDESVVSRHDIGQFKH
jgi:polar amino acid transport system substrate-binding protein